MVVQLGINTPETAGAVAPGKLKAFMRGGSGCLIRREPLILSHKLHRSERDLVQPIEQLEQLDAKVLRQLRDEVR